MADDYTVITPENVELRFDVAGLGSRSAAALIDYTILFVGYGLLTVGGSFVVAALPTSPAVSPTTLARVFEYAVVAIVILLTFFGWWGYFTLGELLWNGQSIGKRQLGLRVVRAGGQPISLSASLARNLLRVVDLFLGLGVVTMLLDRQSRRLGDFAAGTLVVREPRVTNLRSTRLFDPVEMPLVEERRIDELQNAERVTSTQYAVIRDYFARKSKLSSHRATQLAEQIARRIAATLEIAPADVGDPVAFLATAARAFEARENRRN